MADKFVATNGSNSNAGSLAAPWLDLEHGMDTINSGDTLWIRGGTYPLVRATAETRIANGTAGAWTTVRNYADELVTVTPGPAGTNNMLAFRLASRNWQYIQFIASVQDGITFDMQGLDRAHGFQMSSLNATQNRFITLQNIRFMRCWNQGILGYNTEDLSLINCTCSENGQRDMTDNFEHGFYGSGLRLLIDGGRYWGNSARGVQLYPQAIDSSIIVRNIRAWRNKQGISTAGPRGVSIYNNECFENEVEGISHVRGNNCHIYHNSCHHNGNWGIVVGNDSSGLYGGIEVKNNLSLENGTGTGTTTGDIWIATRTTGAVCTWNRIGRDAIRNTGTNATLANNTFNATAAANWVDSTTATLANRNYRLISGAPAIGHVTTNNVPNVGIDVDRTGLVRSNPPDQGANEFGVVVPSEPLGLWTVQNQIPAGNWLNSIRTAQTCRWLMRKEAWDTSIVGAFKLVFKGRTDAPHTVQKVTIVEREGLTLDGVDATNQLVTFGSTWAAGGVVPQNGELFSDTIVLALDHTRDYWVTAYYPGAVGPAFDNTGGADTAYFVAADEAADIDWAAKTITGAFIFPHVYGVQRIEETAIPQVPESSPIIAHLSPYVVLGLTPIATHLSDPNEDIVQATLLGDVVSVHVDHTLATVDEYTG